MRTTAPALRRRNYAQKLSRQQWLARRHAQQGEDTDTDGLDADGSDNDDFPQPRTTIRRKITRTSLSKRDENRSGDDHSGDASGEDGLDSGDDSDDNIPSILTRPAPAATQKPSLARLPGARVASVGAGTGGAGPGLAAPPRATPSPTTSSRAASSRTAVPVATNAVPFGSGVGSGLGVVYLPPPNLAATPPGTGAAAVAPGAAGLPSSTLGVVEDETITSASDSDGIESGNPSDSGSSDSEDSDNEANKSSSVTSPSATATAAPALGGSAGSSGLIGASSTGPVTAITPTPADFFFTAPRSSASAAPIPTGVAGANPNGGDLPTLALPETSPQPTPPTGLGELQGGGSTTNGAVTAEQSRPNAGAAAGIVIGVLAAIGILVGFVFVWRKWRQDGKVIPQLPLFWRKSGNDDYPPDIKKDFDPDMIPILPPPNTYQEPKKTNSEMMDRLMQATFKAENGDRSTQGSFPDISNRAVASDDASQRAMDNVGPGFVQQARGPGFMDETAYTALAGPPTPAPTKPVQRWLEDVKTPRSSVGVKWPVSAVPPMPTMQVPFQSDEMPVGKPRDEQFLPPQPAYAANNPRYTTTTTTSSSTEDFWFRGGR